MQSLLWNTYWKQYKFVVEPGHVCMDKCSLDNQIYWSQWFHFDTFSSSKCWGTGDLLQIHFDIEQSKDTTPKTGVLSAFCSVDKMFWLTQLDDLFFIFFFHFCWILGVFQWTTTTFRNNDTYWKVWSNSLCGRRGWLHRVPSHRMTFSVLCLLHLSFSIAFLWNILSCWRPFLFQTQFDITCTGNFPAPKGSQMRILLYYYNCCMSWLPPNLPNWNNVKHPHMLRVTLRVTFCLGSE